MSDALLFLVLTLASYRLWRIPGLDEWPPSKWLSGWLERRTYEYADTRMPSEIGKGEPERMEPVGVRSPFWDEVRTLVECPWCLGFWVSGLVVLVVDLWFVDLAMPVLWWLAVSCGVGLIGSTLDG